MAVFFDNNFVAQSHMKSVSPSETFDSFLGIDAAVKIEYKPSDKFNETSGMFQKSSSETIQQRTSVKNTKSIDVDIVVADQIPVSTDDKIKVRLIEPDLTRRGNEFIKNIPSTGTVEWTLKIKPGESEDLTLKYSIEYPQNRTIERVVG